ncbi:RNA 3'-terminal phosphate cyclase [Roseibacillus persicicus]|uniref:RNA 3'-terminal phosphate cyclase n=1 Tax=Roseibacillus persicicus TaxID=454148 RepID=UPI00398B8727
MKLIQLNGQSGGGQMLRTALSLAMVTGQPFRMTHIRGQRSKPGLMRQHLTCVKAAVEISQGTADGAELGSTELVFRAGEIQAGDYEFAIGTAGSTTLLLQTLLPALWMAKGKSTLRLSGGTHNPLAPPFDFVEQVFLPAMKKFGADATIRLVETGFAPTGGGILEARISPTAGLGKVNFTERGELQATSLRVISRQVSDSVASRLMDAVGKAWPCDERKIEHRDEGPGQGLIGYAEAHFANGCEMVSGCGERGQSAEKIGHRMGKSMATFVNTRAAVGRHLADQLLLPMALAGGGEITTTAPDAHVPTNVSIIEKFLPVKFSIEDEGGGLFRISC